MRVCVSKPSCGWGSVDASSIGIAHKHEGNGVVRVNFPEVDDWKGKVSELEVVREGGKDQERCESPSEEIREEAEIWLGSCLLLVCGYRRGREIRRQGISSFSPAIARGKACSGDLEVVEGGSTTPRATATETTTQRAVFLHELWGKILDRGAKFLWVLRNEAVITVMKKSKGREVSNLGSGSWRVDLPLHSNRICLRLAEQL